MGKFCPLQNVQRRCFIGILGRYREFLCRYRKNFGYIENFGVDIENFKAYIENCHNLDEFTGRDEALKVTDGQF